MGKYSSEILDAKSLIKEFGQKVIWRKTETALDDPAKPWGNSSAVDTDYSVDMVFLPKTVQLAEAIRGIQGSITKSGEVMGLMGTVSFSPDSKDIVIRNGVVYQIEAIDELNPNGESILFTVNFKG